MRVKIRSKSRRISGDSNASVTSCIVPVPFRMRLTFLKREISLVALSNPAFQKPTQNEYIALSKFSCVKTAFSSPKITFRKIGSSMSCVNSSIPSDVLLLKNRPVALKNSSAVRLFTVVPNLDKKEDNRACTAFPAFVCIKRETPLPPSPSIPPSARSKQTSLAPTTAPYKTDSP